MAVIVVPEPPLPAKRSEIIDDQVHLIDLLLAAQRRVARSATSASIHNSPAANGGLQPPLLLPQGFKTLAGLREARHPSLTVP